MVATSATVSRWALIALIVSPSASLAQQPVGSYQIGTSSLPGEAVVTFQNSTGGAICANSYLLVNSTQDLVSCCSCEVPAGGVRTTTISDLMKVGATPAAAASSRLIAHALLPTSFTVGVVASTGTCNASAVAAASLTSGLLPSISPGVGSPVTVGAFQSADLNLAGTGFANILTRLTNICSAIQSDTIAICASCRTGPQLSSNPVNTTVCEGKTATFTASALDATSVQWQVKLAGSSTFTDIPSATGLTLTISNAAGAMNGNQYQAAFTNAAGSAMTTAALLTVNTPPLVTLNPVPLILNVGDTATFTAAASGTPSPTVQWRVSTDNGATFNAIPGATSNTLSFPVTAAMNGYRYQAVFTNTCGQAVTDPPITLTLRQPDAHQVYYAAHLADGDSIFNITNSGASGGDLCVNVYAFSPDEHLLACCSCPVTPNGLVSLSANGDLLSNTLGSTTPSSIVVKLVAAIGPSCNPSAVGALGAGMLAWGSTLHQLAAGFARTEVPFTIATLAASEQSRVASLCGFILANGSGYGICRTCRSGALGGAKK